MLHAMPGDGFKGSINNFRISISVFVRVLPEENHEKIANPFMIIHQSPRHRISSKDIVGFTMVSLLE